MGFLRALAFQSVEQQHSEFKAGGGIGKFNGDATVWTTATLCEVGEEVGETPHSWRFKE
jgi:hypothetical protein